MDDDSHPLLSAKILAVFTLLGVSGVGMSLILAQRAAVVGLVVAVLCSAGIFWLYAKPLRAAVETGRWNGQNSPSRLELSIAVLASVGSFILTLYLFCQPPNEPGPASRTTVDTANPAVLGGVTLPLQSSLPRTPPASAGTQEPPVTADTPFNRVAAPELRALVQKLSERLRSFERAYHDKVNAIVSSPDAGGRFQKTNSLLDKAQSDEIAEFQKTYLPEVRSLIDEMLKRLKLPHPLRDIDGLSADGRQAFSAGLVYGPNPLTNLADYMDGLAGKLR